MTTTVHHTEHERGWGSRVETILEFKYADDAEAHVEKKNEEWSKDSYEYFWRASIAYCNGVRHGGEPNTEAYTCIK